MNSENQAFNKKLNYQSNPDSYLENYKKDQLSKKIDMIMMVKVKDQMTHKNENNQDKISEKIGNFEKNDSLIATNLDVQTSSVNNRLAQRKMNSKILDSSSSS